MSSQRWNVNELAIAAGEAGPYSVEALVLQEYQRIQAGASEGVVSGTVVPEADTRDLRRAYTNVEREFGFRKTR